jgi:hypothetical protein
VTIVDPMLTAQPAKALVDDLRDRTAAAKAKQTDVEAERLARIVDYYIAECSRLADTGANAYVERYAPEQAQLAQSIVDALVAKGAPATLVRENDGRPPFATTACVVRVEW